METGLKAFFYDYKYYLLPEGCNGVEDVKALKFAEVKRLKEENCMAPNFVYGCEETEFLEIEAPGRVFEATVNFYTAEEYNDVLRGQVEKRCPGCDRYIDDGEAELKGHHREMSLEGVCYSRVGKEDPAPFTLWARWLWERVAENADRLAEMIGRNDQTGISRLINRWLNCFFVDPQFYGGTTEEGRYCLCMSAEKYPQAGLRAVLKMLADTANAPLSPLAAAGWTVYPYFPKGIYVPKLRPDYFKRPPRIFYSEESETGEAEIVIYDKNVGKWSDETLGRRKSAIYRYLCHYVGEDVLLAGSTSISFAEELPTEGRQISAEELAGLLERRAKEIYEGELPFPAPLYLQAADAEIDALPFKEGVQTWATICPEMSPESLSESPEANNTLFEDFGIVYAYIYLPASWADDFGAKKKEALDWYLGHADEYPAPITLPENKEVFVKHVGVVFAQSGLCEDCMVFDEKEFFRVLRNLAPVLTGLGAKIVTVKRDGVIVYEPGYTIRPADSGLCS